MNDKPETNYALLAKLDMFINMRQCRGQRKN